MCFQGNEGCTMDLPESNYESKIIKTQYREIIFSFREILRQYRNVNCMISKKHKNSMIDLPFLFSFLYSEK